MLKKSEKLTLIKATAATGSELEELYKMGQPSISSAVPHTLGVDVTPVDVTSPPPLEQPNSSNPITRKIRVNRKNLFIATS